MTDTDIMRRCIELARASVEHGNHPFGSVVVHEGSIIGEGENSVKTLLDPSAHGEAMAIRAACQALSRLDLRDCELFTSCEPCFLCSHIIRKTGIRRVVFAVASPDIGGYSSQFSILRADPLADFASPPLVEIGLLHDESMALFNELGWTVR